MRVSIIVPLYNQADFVRETLDSALAQSYPDFEIIIVNDASTDGRSGQVADAYALGNPARIRVIHNPVNLGLPATRNVAIRAATGELILPLDSDDRIHPDFLAKTTALMIDGVGLVSTWIHICPTEDMIRKGHSPHMTGQPGSGYPIYPPRREQILNGNCLSVCSLLRKSMLDELGGYPESMNRGSEDWALWAMIVWKTNWATRVVREHLFYYRIHKDSMCRSTHMAPFEESKAKIRRLCGA
jgi:glycosyltransferase involved in cell wall biosynthesis